VTFITYEDGAKSARSHDPHELGGYLTRLPPAVQDPPALDFSGPARPFHSVRGQLGDGTTVAEDDAEVSWVEHAADRDPGELGAGTQVGDAELESVCDEDSGDSPRHRIDQGSVAGRASQELQMRVDLDQVRLPSELECPARRTQTFSIEPRKRGRGDTELLAERWIRVTVDRQGVGAAGGELPGEQRRDGGLPNPALAGDRDLQRADALDRADALLDGRLTNS
jgi:hypothetical protein